MGWKGGACFGKDNHNDTNQTISKQGCLYKNHADGKAAENNKFI